MNEENEEELKDAIRTLAKYERVDGETTVTILGDRIRFFAEGVSEFEYIERAVQLTYETHYLED